MKKKTVLFLVGMLLAVQSVNAAERIEKEPVKVVGDSIRAPETKTVQEEKLIETRPGEEPEEAVTETTENETYTEPEEPETVQETTENEAYTEVKETEIQQETAENETAAVLNGDARLHEDNTACTEETGENEESEEAAKRKETVRSVNVELADMPYNLELDGKTCTAYTETGIFCFYYDAEKYNVKRKDKTGGNFFVELTQKEDNGDKIWIDGFFEECYVDIKPGLPDMVPGIGSTRIGAYEEPAFFAGFSMADGVYRETEYTVSTGKGYLKIRVMAETEEGFAELQKVVDTFVIEDVNWDRADVREFLDKVQIHTADENEMPEKVNTEK